MINQSNICDWQIIEDFSYTRKEIDILKISHKNEIILWLNKKIISVVPKLIKH